MWDFAQIAEHNTGINVSKGLVPKIQISIFIIAEGALESAVQKHSFLFYAYLNSAQNKPR